MGKTTTSKVFRLSLACLVIILLGGAVALLLSGSRAAIRPARAVQGLYNDLSVVGPPTLPAATVNAIFTRLGSPMVGTGAVVEQTSRQTGIDDAFALAVWWTETNDGAAGVGLADRNPGSVRGSIGYPSAYDGYTIYPSYTDAIIYWFHMLKNRYVANGLSTVYAISHPYVGTSTSYLWAGKVVNLMLRYRGEAPPPTPVPTLVPSPTFSPLLPHHQRFSNASGWNAPPVQQQSQPSTLTTTADTSPLSQQTQLSPVLTWSIALAALLLAVAIALWARKLPTPAPATAGANLYGRSPYANSPPFANPYERYQPAWNTSNLAMPQSQANPVPLLRLPTHPLPTEPLSGTFGAYPEYPFARPPETPGKLRRTILLPSQPESKQGEEAVTVETTRSRPTGLLARYGK